MVEVQLLGQRYVIKMAATETIEITINSSSVYTRTIGTGKEATVSFNLEERIPEGV